MTLIACPECGREVSGAAKNCPQCGLPAPGEVLLAQAKALAHDRAARRERKLMVIGLAVIFVALMILGSGFSE